MAFAASGLSLRDQLIGGKHRNWTYRYTDTLATVTAADYIANASTYGLVEGDTVTYEKTDANPPLIANLYVSEIDATDNATLAAAPVDNGTATATAGAATLSRMAGVITSEALTTAAGAAYTLTLTNTYIAAADIVLVSVQNGTNSQGVVVVGLVTPGAGSVVITVRNEHASQAFNGTIKVSFVVFKTA